MKELVIPTLQPKIQRPAPGRLPQQVRLASKLPPGSVDPCSRHPRGLQPSPGASGQCAGSCLFIHLPRQPSCLRSAHTMGPVFWSPLPHPRTKGTEVEREVATGLPISSGKGEEQSRGNSGKSFSKTCWRQGFLSGSCQSLHPGLMITRPHFRSPLSPAVKGCVVESVRLALSGTQVDGEEHSVVESTPRSHKRGA